MERKEGLRHNEGKVRTDLFPADVLLNISEVLTEGAKKYEDHNWEHGMDWSKTIGSLKRHLAQFEMGEDYDAESKLPHVDHLACNAVFLSRYFRSHPEKDDRLLSYIMHNKRIALDIDGVIADFTTPFLKRIGLSDQGNASWYMSYKARDGEMWKKLFKDKDFWLRLKPLIDPDSLRFEPVAYVTARGIPQEWTERWIEDNGFPCNPVYVVDTNGGEHGSKVKYLKSIECDIFIDDHYQHFVELNQSGITTFLQDTYYNRRYNVGSRRIKHPNDVLKLK